MPEFSSPDIRPLALIMERLRSPEGCPWDRAQDHRSLQRYLLEEAHECLHAIDALLSAPEHRRTEAEAELRDELGDLLLQVVFHAQLAAEREAFNLQDVIDAISRKMRGRHPHVFGDAQAASPEEVERIWSEARRAERGASASAHEDPLALPAEALPALALAARVGARAARTGMDWPDAAAVLDKVDEELDELREAFAGGDRQRIEEELGDLLLALASFARHAGIEAEDALRRAVRRFLRRARRARDIATGEGVALAASPAAAVHAFWLRAKAAMKREGLE